MTTPGPLTAIAAACLFVTASTPEPATPVSDALRASARRAAGNFVAAAEALPADKYGYKPTPAQMSAGQIVAHIAQGNDYVCALIGGAAAPKRSEPKADAPKPELIDRLRESFRFCESALAKLNDSQLGAKVSYFGSEITRAQAMFGAVEEWGGHYSQLAVYLRLNGVLPPTARGDQS
jgi:uncharacterized damage-inducible protein DinB